MPRFPIAGPVRRRLLPGILLAAAATAVAPGPAAAGPRWLPPDTAFPRLVADRREPGISLSYATDPDRFDAALGGPLPLARFTAGSHDLTAVLEAGAFFRLGKDGTFFPLQTFDGLLGLGLETASGPFRGRLRFTHISAHKADGDSTVIYRGQTYSREFWRLEVGRWWHRLFLYAGIGSSWHAVPTDQGPHLVAGGSWEAGGGSWRPFAALHLSADQERAWRVDQSLFAGVATGVDRVFRIGLQYVAGNRPDGQYWITGEQFLGIKLQFLTCRRH